MRKGRQNHHAFSPPLRITYYSSRTLYLSPRASNLSLTMVKFRPITSVVLLGILLLSVSNARGDEWADGFRSPPDSARPHTWWHWVSGNVSREGITKDLEAMKRIGVGGAQMFSVDQVPNPKYRGHVLYMSTEWQVLTKHAIAEATRLGLMLYI